ncbi:MAG: ATP synthase F1 subunit delta [Muribaculaceae bacterium]|nr:ATP synthase F1 subunit delta [Muribaculaceae bacterium]
MNDGLIPKRYAKALFKLAVENGDQEAIYYTLRDMSGRHTAVDELKRVMGNPTIGDDEKGRLMSLAVGAKPGSSLEKFIMLIIRNNRAEFLRKIALSYVDIYREKHNIAKVVVTTATQLPSATVQPIIDLIKRLLPDMTLELYQEIDPELIGGFTVKMKDYLLDASVRNELMNLRLKLLS